MHNHFFWVAGQNPYFLTCNKVRFNLQLILVMNSHCVDRHVKKPNIFHCVFMCCLSEMHYTTVSKKLNQICLPQNNRQPALSYCSSSENILHSCYCVGRLLTPIKCHGWSHLCIFKISTQSFLFWRLVCIKTIDVHRGKKTTSVTW